jgi:hypothetical protein
MPDICFCTFHTSLLALFFVPDNTISHDADGCIVRKVFAQWVSALSEMVRKCTFACPNVLYSQMLFLLISSPPLFLPFHLLRSTRVLLLFPFSQALHCLRFCSSIKVFEDFWFRNSRHIQPWDQARDVLAQVPSLLRMFFSSSILVSLSCSIFIPVALFFCDFTSSSAYPTLSLH